MKRESEREPKTGWMSRPLKTASAAVREGPSWKQPPAVREVRPATGAYSLRVDAAEFRRAAKLFASWIPRMQWAAPAGFWLRDGRLVLRIGNDEALVPAEGHWPGAVVATIGFVAGVAHDLPEGGSLVLLADSDHIRIGLPAGSRVIRCERLDAPPAWPQFVEQLTPLRLIDFLLLPQRYSAASIAHSGLADRVHGSVTSIRDLVDCLRDQIDETCEGMHLAPDEALEALEYLTGPGLEQLQRRRVDRSEHRR